MSNVERIAAKVQELIDSGKSTDEALREVLEAELPKARTGKDNIANIKALRNIPELRRVRKIAYAKISKSKGKEDSIARYKKEIEACDLRINELIAEVNAAEIPWKKAMELGEDAAGALNYFIPDFKDRVDGALDRITKDMTKAKIKSQLQDLQAKVPSQVPDELKAAFQERVDHSDMMLITICKKMALVSKLSNK
jgi:hypothetical protein